MFEGVTGLLGTAVPPADAAAAFSNVWSSVPETLDTSSPSKGFVVLHDPTTLLGLLDGMYRMVFRSASTTPTTDLRASWSNVARLNVQLLSESWARISKVAAVRWTDSNL